MPCYRVRDVSFLHELNKFVYKQNGKQQKNYLNVCIRKKFAHVIGVTSGRKSNPQCVAAAWKFLLKCISLILRSRCSRVDLKPIKCRRTEFGAQLC